MTNRTAAFGPPRRRDDLRPYASTMIAHLRAEVLAVPGRRAAVRAALGHTPGSPRTFGAYRELTAFMPEAPSQRQEHALLAVAAMFCAQPASNRHQDSTSGTKAEDAQPPETAKRRSLGHSCAEAVNDGRIAPTSMEGRLHQLCRLDVAGVHRQLPRLVHHLRGVGVEIDWVELIVDLAAWDAARERIASRWLREFYRARTARSESATSTSSNESQENRS